MKKFKDKIKRPLVLFGHGSSKSASLLLLLFQINRIRQSLDRGSASLHCAYLRYDNEPFPFQRKIDRKQDGSSYPLICRLYFGIGNRLEHRKPDRSAPCFRLRIFLFALLDIRTLRYKQGLLLLDDSFLHLSLLRNWLQLYH